MNDMFCINQNNSNRMISIIPGTLNTILFISGLKDMTCNCSYEL